jgi:hypothetical protein
VCRLRGTGAPRFMFPGASLLVLRSLQNVVLVVHCHDRFAAMNVDDVKMCISMTVLLAISCIVSTPRFVVSCWRVAARDFCDCATYRPCMVVGL